MSKRKHPWTHWATMAYILALMAGSSVCWILEVPQPTGWLALALFAPMVMLAWLDNVKTAKAETDYQDHMLRDEVRRAVKAELDGRAKLPRTVDVVFETTDDVVVPAGTAVVAPAVRRNGDES